MRLQGSTQKFLRGEHHCGCTEGGGGCKVLFAAIAEKKSVQLCVFVKMSNKILVAMVKDYTRNVCRRDHRRKENRSERGDEEEMRGVSVLQKHCADRIARERNLRGLVCSLLYLPPLVCTLLEACSSAKQSQMVAM